MPVETQPINRFAVEEYYWKDVDVDDLVIIHDYADSVNEWMVTSIDYLGDHSLIYIRADRNTEKTITVHNASTVLVIPNQGSSITKLVSQWISREASRGNE